MQNSALYKSLHHKKGNNRKLYKKKLIASLNNSPFFRKDEKNRYWIKSEKKLLHRNKRHKSEKIILNIKDLKTQFTFNKIIFGLFAIKKFNSYKKMSKESGFCESTVYKKIKWNTKCGKIEKTINLIDPESDLKDDHSNNSYKRINEIQEMLWMEHGLCTKQINIEKNKKIVALFGPNTYSLKKRYYKQFSNNTSIVSLVNTKTMDADSLATRTLTGLAHLNNRKKIIKKKIHPNSKDRFVLEIKNIEPKVNLYRFNKKVYTFENYISNYSYQ